jgi:hypothetical protein
VCQRLRTCSGNEGSPRGTLLTGSGILLSVENIGNNFAPSRAKIFAVARPLPDPAPVMIAVLPYSTHVYIIVAQHLAKNPSRRADAFGACVGETVDLNFRIQSVGNPGKTLRAFAAIS